MLYIYMEYNWKASERQNLLAIFIVFQNVGYSTTPLLQYLGFVNF